MTEALEPRANESDVVTTRAKRPGTAKRAPLSSAQQIGSTIKTVRNQLRKDSGLSGDADRLPQLTWLLFLKALDDFDYAREEEYGDAYEPVIEPPYRWRDWAAVEDKAQRMTGDELLSFVNDRLIPYLSRLSGTSDRDIRTIVGAIFQETANRIRSGYILREVVDKLSTINFNASDDIHTLSLFYETMLREMRDASGDNGEFYTPRPLVRFIVNRVAPQLGDTILDPACGTGGFLVETWERLKGEARRPEQREALQSSLVGFEKKPLPYLLCTMNLLLHGIEQPNVVERNPLRSNIRQVRDVDRVDVVITNPPFGGEEERGVLNNFPEGMRTAETALLFFQLVMAKLKRSGGRCGIVLPNGFLFGTGVAAEVKKQLLNRFNLHTIVRLPNGVFAPYTDISTNLLFFDACPPDSEEPCTHEIWYYELPLPEGRRTYTKTKPLKFEEFADCIAWWDQRVDNEHAWLVPVEQVIESGYNLDSKNPHSGQELETKPPEEILVDLVAKERRILDLLAQIKEVLATSPSG